MAIQVWEDDTNEHRIAACHRRIRKQLVLEDMFRNSRIEREGYIIPINVTLINAIKTEFAELKSEIIALQNNVTGN